MAAKQLIGPEILFVFIRVHSWLKISAPPGGAPRNHLASAIFKDHQVEVADYKLVASFGARETGFP
jgi:hypothetical protein